MAEGMVQIVKLASSLLVTVSLGAWLAGCGTESGVKNPNVITDQPVLIATLPSQGAPGGTVTLQGVGFSIVPDENIIILDDTSSQGLSHRFLDPLPPNGAVEEITFLIPLNAVPGATQLIVLVEERPSNSLPFTVESP